MQLVTAAHSGRGDRAINEDAFDIAVAPGRALLVVADGVGGHGGGADAARCCVASIVDGFAGASGLADLPALVDAADRAVAALRRERGAPADSMRTTVALLALCGDTARSAHIGDSRIYWFRNGILMQRTRDHSVAEIAGSDDPVDRSRLFRTVGAGRGVTVDLGDAVSIASGDAFLLCSDGVWNLLSDDDIVACHAMAATPEQWRAALVRAIEVGSDGQIDEDPNDEDRDNFTLIAAMVVE